MTTDFLTDLAEQKAARLCREAGTARLAALARCCRPSTWSRSIRRATRALVRLRDAARRDRSAQPCCAPA